MSTTLAAPQLNRPLILGTLILASMAAVMSTDMYAPSLAVLPEILGTSASWVQITMGINALFFGLAQLLHGPMADRYGRRPVMLWGVALFALFSLLCGMAQTIEQLIVARALQGAAASVEAVLLLAIIGDIYSLKERPKAFALYGMVWAVAPALAPIAGGHIHELAGWYWNFYIIAITALIAFGLSFWFLPETGTVDKEALQGKKIIVNYAALLKNKAFLGLALLMSLPLAGILVYITSAPFIFQQQFDFSVTQVGYYQALMVLAYMLASAAVPTLVNRFAQSTLIKAGVTFCLLGMLGTALVLLSDAFSANQILIGMLVFSLGFGPLFAVTPGLIMEQAATSRGTAAALLGAIEMCVAGIAIAVVSAFSTSPPQAMAYTFIVLAGLIGLVCRFKPWLINQTSI
tara:strand:+ start:54 stop:1265 length:1212 start_codon:yes stop_codon:yes gene_type:complete